MANEVFQTVEIELEDGKKITLKPLPIKLLRKFMSAWNDGLNTDPEEDGGKRKLLNDDDIMDVYTECNAIALSRQLADTINPVEQFDNYKEYSGLKDDYKDYLETNLNVPNTNKVLEICGGITGDDPKLMEAAMVAMEDGLN